MQGWQLTSHLPSRSTPCPAWQVYGPSSGEHEVCAESAGGGPDQPARRGATASGFLHGTVLNDSGTRADHLRVPGPVRPQLPFPLAPQPRASHQCSLSPLPCDWSGDDNESASYGGYKALKEIVCVQHLAQRLVHSEHLSDASYISNIVRMHDFTGSS